MTRAAERLGIQQPPLSRQIKAIERELNVQLFRRKGRGIELTDAGRAFLDRAQAMLLNLDQAVEATRRTARGEEGRINVGITPTGPFYPFVPRVIRTFREAYPRVALTLEECPSPELIECLRNEQMDVAFLRTPIADQEGLVINPLLEEPMVVALPRAHPLAKSNGGRDAAISVKALARETFIVYGRPQKPGQHGLGQYEAMIAACHAAGFSPRIGQEAPRVASTLSLVAVGLGISLVPASLSRMNMDGVVYHRLKGTIQPKAILHLASRRSDPSVVGSTLPEYCEKSRKGEARRTPRHEAGTTRRGLIPPLPRRAKSEANRTNCLAKFDLRSEHVGSDAVVATRKQRSFLSRSMWDEVAGFLRGPSNAVRAPSTGDQGR